MLLNILEICTTWIVSVDLVGYLKGLIEAYFSAHCVYSATSKWTCPIVQEQMNAAMALSSISSLNMLRSRLFNNSSNTGALTLASLLSLL